MTLVTSPLVEIRFHVPAPRRGVVTRSRLMDRLRSGVSARLILVSAPAGFGKTTLTADWLRSEGVRSDLVAWVSLEQSDGPIDFWSYVVTSLQRVAPAVGAGALAPIQDGRPADAAVLTPLVNDLAALGHDVWLVLDDYHLVDGDAIAPGMTFLLDHVPPTVHVVVCTRVDPLLPLARWRARGELIEVRAAELRFTAGEASAYLKDVVGLDLSTGQVANLEERTEGWIAALQLAALSMQGRSDVDQFISGFAGNDRYVVDYLVEEVLAHQSDRLRDFLLRTAVLDRLTGPLCDALTRGIDGATTLADLERANVFLSALDDSRTWYRYHQLFADVLRARLLAQDPDLVRELHLSSSRWFEANDLVPEAVRHALLARDYGRAAFLVELAAPSMRRGRQEGRLLNWLSELPDAVIQSSPVLSAFTGYRYLVSGELEAVEPWLAAAERALSEPDGGASNRWAQTEELRRLPSTIELYRAAIAQSSGDMAGIARHARRALDVADPDDHMSRGGAQGFLGLAAWAQGDVQLALATFGDAVARLHDAGALVDELSSSVVLADLWLVAGRPSNAVALYERALRLAAAQGDAFARASADLHTGLSEIDCEMGDLGSARRHLELAAALGKHAAMGESGYRWFVAMSRIARAEGDLERSITLLEEAHGLYRPSFFPDIRPIPAMTARVRIAQRRLVQATDWARDRGLVVAGDVSYADEFDHLTLVRLVVAQHREAPGTVDLSGTSALLDRLAQAAVRAGRAGSLLEIRMLRAIVDDAAGRREASIERLADAWVEAPEPERYVRLFLDEGAPMLDLLGEAAQHSTAKVHARPLLAAASPGGAPAGAVAGLMSGTTLSEREHQVLRLLDTELTGPEIARELFISPNTLRTHTKSIFTKLDVTSRRAAVRRGHELGLA